MPEANEKILSVEIAAETPSAPLRLSSEALFRHGNTVCYIQHAGQTYWLRLTRGNKLILTK